MSSYYNILNTYIVIVYVHDDSKISRVANGEGDFRRACLRRGFGEDSVAQLLASFNIL